MRDRCPACRTGWLYDSSDEQARSISCVMCGRSWFHAPPVLPNGRPPAPPCGRRPKEIAS